MGQHVCTLFHIFIVLFLCRHHFCPWICILLKNNSQKLIYHVGSLLKRIFYLQRWCQWYVPSCMKFIIIKLTICLKLCYNKLGVGWSENLSCTWLSLWCVFYGCHFSFKIQISYAVDVFCFSFLFSPCKVPNHAQNLINLSQLFFNLVVWAWFTYLNTNFNIIL